jgi:hypothetical protein
MFGQNYQKDKLNQVLKKRVVGIEIMAKIYDEDNVFAKILRAEIPYEKVLENKYALAFNDINPQAPIHILGNTQKPLY